MGAMHLLSLRRLTAMAKVKKARSALNEIVYSIRNSAVANVTAPPESTATVWTTESAVPTVTVTVTEYLPGPTETVAVWELAEPQASRILSMGSMVTGTLIMMLLIILICAGTKAFDVYSKSFPKCEADNAKKTDVVAGGKAAHLPTTTKGEATGQNAEDTKPTPAMRNLGLRVVWGLLVWSVCSLILPKLLVRGHVPGDPVFHPVAIFVPFVLLNAPWYVLPALARGVADACSKIWIICYEFLNEKCDNPAYGASLEYEREHYRGKPSGGSKTNPQPAEKNQGTAERPPISLWICFFGMILFAPSSTRVLSNSIAPSSTPVLDCFLFYQILSVVGIALAYIPWAKLGKFAVTFFDRTLFAFFDGCDAAIDSWINFYEDVANHARKVEAEKSKDVVPVIAEPEKSAAAPTETIKDQHTEEIVVAAAAPEDSKAASAQNVKNQESNTKPMSAGSLTICSRCGGYKKRQSEAEIKVPECQSKDELSDDVVSESESEDESENEGEWVDVRVG